MAILQRTGVTGSLSISSSRIPRSTSASLFSVNGYNGRLINVVDSLSGSLFSVNSIAGLPIFEVFSNNRIVAGKYNANDFVISGSRVGIGTARPAYEFEVSASTADNANARIGWAEIGSNPQYSGYAYFGTTRVNQSAAGNYAMLQGSDGTTFLNASSGKNIYIRIANADAMIVDSNRNVGIGTTSALTTGGTAGLSIVNSAAALSVGATNNDMMYLRRNGSAIFQFQTYNGTNAGEIHLQPYGGSVGIGTTSLSYTLDVNGTVRGERYRGINSLVLNTYTTVNPASNVFIYSQANDRDSWLYLDSADTTSNWGIYHRQIDSAVSNLPANSIGFIGGGTNTLQSYISLANGNAYFAGNVGIGTTNPTSKTYILDSVDSPALGTLRVRSTGGNSSICIDSNSTSQYSYFTLAQNGTGKFEMGIIPTTSDFYLNPNVQVGATNPAIFIKKADGNIGIGTTSPTNKLDTIVSVASGNFLTDANIYPLALKNNNTTAGNAVGITFGQGGYSYTNFIASVRTGTGAEPKGDLVLGGRPTDGSAFTETMRLQAGGNVGIGTSTVSYKFHVYRGVASTDAIAMHVEDNTSYLRYIPSLGGGSYNGASVAGGSALITTLGREFWIGQHDGAAIRFASDETLYIYNGAGTVNLTSATTGNIGIGVLSPAAKLHLSSSSTTSLRIETRTNSAADSEIEFVGPDTHSYAMGIDESDSDKFKISYAASRTPPTLGTNDRFVIQTDGKIGIGTSVAETDLSVVDMNFGRVGIGTVTYYGVWLTGGTSATDFSFLSSPSDTNLYLNAPSTKAIYNQINNVNRFIISADNVRINNSAAGADGEEFQRWSYISTDNYYLKLIQTVTAGVVRYNFSMVNNATAYNNVLVLDRGNVGVGSTTPAYKLDVTGTAAISGDVGLGGVPDAAARLYVQGEALTEPFLSVQTCLGNNSTNSSFYTSFKGWLAVKIGNNVGTAGNLLTTGTYYIRLWG